MPYELIALVMFSSMMAMLMTGQRVFGAIGAVASVAAMTLWGVGGVDIPFSAAMKLMKWYPLLTLPMFVFMGYVLSESKIADDLYKMFHVWMGPLNGGLAIGTILLMVLISAMNGLSVAGMAIGATIALPELLRRGYDKQMVTRRNFLTTAGAIGAASAAISAPVLAQSKIKWRMQTYAGPALAKHVVKPAIDSFNKIAGDQMQIELFFSDQLVPTGELFQAMQKGTIDAVQSDDDSMASPTEVTVFGGYFPFASRYSLDVPVLFNQYGLNAIWDAEYSKVGVKHISAGAWDPCHFATKDPINSLADLKGKRVFTFPTAGRFLAQFGVVPVTLPWEDIEVAVQTGELDGIAWSGITEDYTVGWADVTNYFLTNNISGAWAGSFFANMDRWNEVPAHLQELLRVCMDQSHYYRQWWYWGGEASLRVNGTKMKPTTIPDQEWAQVESAAVKFWDEIAKESPTKAKVIKIIKQYNADMVKAGRPYRYG